MELLQAITGKKVKAKKTTMVAVQLDNLAQCIQVRLTFESAQARPPQARRSAFLRSSFELQSRYLHESMMTSRLSSTTFSWTKCFNGQAMDTAGIERSGLTASDFHEVVNSV